jgi:hypothetical protein
MIPTQCLSANEFDLSDGDCFFGLGSVDLRIALGSAADYGVAAGINMRCR